MNIRTSFRFTLPNGSGVKVEPGRKATGAMRLIHVKDLVAIEEDTQVLKESGLFFVVLLSKTITELGLERMVTRKTIEKLNPADFYFLVDFMHEINHQVIKRVPIACPSCKHAYMGSFAQLGEA
jgi:hypothetical protein